MKGHSRRFSHPWLLPVGAVALIGAHATILHYILHHQALSAPVVLGAIILVAIKLGLLGSLFALFRRRPRN